MSIQEIWTNFKRFVTDSEAVIAVLLVFVGLGSFWLGRLSVTQNMSENVSMGEYPKEIQVAAPLVPVLSDTARMASPTVSDRTSPQNVIKSSDATKGYVASKTGTKYHLPWCSGARRIKDENKVWFATKEEAEAAGYTPAANCKGL